MQAGLLVRRARWLCFIVDADVAFREAGMSKARGLALSRGEVAERGDLQSVRDIVSLPTRRPRALRARQASFDAASYDRLRILSTELRRVQDDGGDIAVRVGSHPLLAARLAKLMSAI